MNDNEQISKDKYKGGRDVRERTYKFGLEIIYLVRSLQPNDVVCRTIARQIIRSGTSISANLEEAYAALTKADFTHSVNISRKEAHETKVWLRFLADSGSIKENGKLLIENEELIRILTSIVKKSQNGKK